MCVRGRARLTWVFSDLYGFFQLSLGSTSGIGAETARVLAKRGARLVLPARNLEAAEDVKARIVSECPESEIVVMSLDLSSLGSVRNFVSEFESLDLPLNLLVYDTRTFFFPFLILCVLLCLPRKQKERKATLFVFFFGASSHFFLKFLSQTQGSILNWRNPVLYLISETTQASLLTSTQFLKTESKLHSPQII